MTEPTLHDSRYSWTRLGVSLLIAVVGNVGMWAIVVIMPAVQADFGVDRAGVSMTYTFTMIGYALGNLLIGRAADRFGMTLCLMGAAATISGGFVLATMAPAIWVLSLLQLVIGFGTAASFGPLIADVSHWFLRRRGIAMAIVASGNYLSGAIWPTILAGVLADQGWRAVYFVLAGIAVIVMVPLSLFLRRAMPEEQSAIATERAALNRATAGFSPRKLTLLLGLAGIGCCVAMSMPQAHIVAYSVDLGFGSEAGAKMLSLMLLGGVGSRLASGFLADKLGGVRTLLLGSVLQCAALFLFLPAGDLTSLYLVSLVFGLAQGGIVPSYAVIVREYMPAKEAGARVGFVIMATIVGMAGGGWISGWIYDLTGSYFLAFVNGIGWNMLNILIVLAILIRSKPRAPGSLAPA
ncbi:MAG: MFS transporter [Rhodobacteraceae bacterium]|nr:MFS transporter [Paracoccaceae bacterium]